MVSFKSTGLGDILLTVVTNKHVHAGKTHYSITLLASGDNDSILYFVFIMKGITEREKEEERSETTKAKGQSKLKNEF